MGINIYFNVRDLLLGTRCIPHLRREQPIVNGAEESEGRRGDNTPIFARNMRGPGIQERGRKIPALVRASRSALRVNKLITSVLQLS